MFVGDPAGSIEFGFLFWWDSTETCREKNWLIANNIAYELCSIYKVPESDEDWGLATYAAKCGVYIPNPSDAVLFKLTWG